MTTDIETSTKKDEDKVEETGEQGTPSVAPLDERLATVGGATVEAGNSDSSDIRSPDDLRRKFTEEEMDEPHEHGWFGFAD